MPSIANDDPFLPDMISTTNSKKSQKLYYWITIIVLFLFSMVAGFLGFQKYFLQHGESYNWIRSVYRTIQIFTFEGGDLDLPIPWMLHIVRFTAPLTAIMAIIMAILEIFNEQWKRFRISRMKNHVVIIGLGTKGKNVMEESIRHHEKVLVIENDPLNPHLELIRQPRCRLILSDATNVNILKKARITKAKTVYMLMGDDSQQVKACLHIYQLIKDSKKNKDHPLDCIMHLLTQDYLNTLRNHKLVQNVNDGLELNIFNVYENSARELFQKNPPDRTGIAADSVKFVQVIIVGFGHAGEALALQTGITGHYLNWKTVLPRVVVFDRQAEGKLRDFQARYPSYHKYCDLESHPIEANSPQLIPELVKYLDNPDAINTVVLCFDNKTNNMLLGLQIDSIELTTSTLPFQVFIRTDDNESFAKFSKNIKPYGLPSNVCSQEVIMGGNLDIQAKAVNSHYLKSLNKGIDVSSEEKDDNWRRLSQEFKDSNRKAADHIGVKIRGIGLEIVSKDDPREPVPFLTEYTEQINLLAKLEHRRWSAERSLAGWTLGKKKNKKIRQTPHLIDWEPLSDEMKDLDRDAVQAIPDVLDSVDLKIVEDNGLT